MEFESKGIQMGLSEEIQMVLKMNLNIRNSNGVGNEKWNLNVRDSNWIQIGFDLWDLNMKFKWVLNYGNLNIEI